MRRYATSTLWAAALLLAACSDTQSGEPACGAEPAIGFRPEVTTRAAKTQLGDGDEFAVWARRTTGSAETMILEAEPVRHTPGGWVYDRTQYWLFGSTYDFHALYPAATPGVTLSSDGTGALRFAVKDFDATGSTDLMVASAEGLDYSAGDPVPEAVTFAFRHLLARVEFIGRTREQATSLTLRSARLYGLPATGSYDGTADLSGTGLDEGVWTPGVPTTEADPFAESADVTLDYTGKSLFGEEPLVLPQRLNGQVVLELSWDDPGTEGGVTVRRATIPSSVVEAWEAGGSYRYTFSVDALNYILFDPPTVVPWNHLSGGSVTIE